MPSRAWGIDGSRCHGGVERDSAIPTPGWPLDHIHHLSCRIPYYRLPRALRECPELRQMGRLTLLERFGRARLMSMKL